MQSHDAAFHDGVGVFAEGDFGTDGGLAEGGSDEFPEWLLSRTSSSRYPFLKLPHRTLKMLNMGP